MFVWTITVRLKRHWRNKMKNIETGVVEVYRGKTTTGHEYVVEHETCEELRDHFSMYQIIEKYPSMRNVYYKWTECEGTEHPDFSVSNPMRVLCRVWNQINRLEEGVYLIAVDDKRTLDIYRKRWLNKKNNWELLEAGMIPFGQAYIVIRR